MLDDGAPQDQHIDPGISALRGSVARHGERRFDRCRPPWLHPGNTAGLQLSDDLVGDFGVKACPVVAGTELVWCVWTSRFSATGRRKPLPRPSTRRGRPGPHSHSQQRRRRTHFGKRTAHPHGCLCVRDGSPKGEDLRSGLQRRRQPGPAGRRRQATRLLGASSRPKVAQK